MTHKLITSAIALFLASALPAAACTVVHELSFRMEGTDYSIEMNGVLLVRDEGGNGGRPLMTYLIPGENTVTVTQHDPNGTAEVQIMKGCEGSFDREGPFDTATLEGESTATLTFTSESDMKLAPSRAVAEGQEGLMEAVKALQAAVKAKDLETVMALHAPLNTDVINSGIPAESIPQFYGFLAEVDTVDLESDLQVTEALDGRVFVVTTADGKPPIAAYAAADGLAWRTGAHWGKVDGKWGVLSPYQ
ncbi:MAG: hypothetical protein AAGC79_08870 [Pseudomonadota bacterium]